MFTQTVKRFYTISAESKYIELFHGGDKDNLVLLQKKFKILTPQEKLKVPSTGGGKIGLSTTTDKRIAHQYSSAFGNKYILHLYLKKSARIHSIDSKGKGIDEILTDDELLALQEKGYDAVKDTNEKEYRILNAKNIITKKLGM